MKFTTENVLKISAAYVFLVGTAFVIGSLTGGNRGATIAVVDILCLSVVVPAILFLLSAFRD
jgi:hypothetical protein